MTSRHWLFIGLILHLIAAFFSVGYQYHDEYFQIIEWVGLKLGRTPPDTLAWEHAAEIRSWFQPFLYFWIAKASGIFGIYNPSSLYFLFRVFGSVLGWLTLIALWATSGRRKIIAILSSLFWFLTYFHARTSAENLSSSFFFLGLALLVSKKTRNALIGVGILWGLAFLTRFQVAIMIASTSVAWLGGKWKEDKKKLFFNTSTLFCAFIFTLGIGVLIDFWGYGHFVFTPWRYFKINILEGKAASFGVSPWWEYFRMTLDQTPMGLGWIIILTTLFGWFLLRKSLFTWATLPFVLIHFWIAHKEARFLYPIAPALPILISAAWEKIPKKLQTFTQKPLWVANTALLLFSLFSAERNSFRWYDYIATHHPDHLRLVGITRDPMMDVTPIYFFRPKNYEYIQVANISELKILLKSRSTEESLYAFHTETLPQAEANEALKQCFKEYSAIPQFFHFFNVNHWLDRAANWSLYRCDSFLSHRSYAP